MKNQRILSVRGGADEAYIVLWHLSAAAAAFTLYKLYTYRIYDPLIASEQNQITYQLKCFHQNHCSVERYIVL